MFLGLEPDEIRAVAEVFQYTTLILSILTLILCLLAGYRWKQARPYLLAMISLALHATAFYIPALADIIPPVVGNLWSAVLRVHAHALLLGVLLVLVKRLHDDEARQRAINNERQ